MERFNCGLIELKAAPDATAEAMIFSGYGAVFGNMDAYGDVIAKGAFAKTIAEFKTSGVWPSMLSQHGGWDADSMTPIGVWTEMREDDHGLYVEGKLADTPRGHEMYALMKMQPRPAINGMSIGFKIIQKIDRSKPEDPRRTLTQVDLVELSLVTFPANGKARVTNIKTHPEGTLMSGELKALLEEQNKAFAEFKSSNDELLKAKAEGKAVSELISKVEAANAEISRLSAELDSVAKKANRPGMGAEDEAAYCNAEHKSAWLNWVRKGQDAGLAELEAKAISVGTPSDGGYAVPIEQDREILRLLREESPMRQVCRVVTIGTEDYTKLVQQGNAGSGWVGEKAARAETTTPTWTPIKPVFGEIYANPAVTQKALDDLFFNVESELATDIAIEFAEQESLAFLTGDGTNKPKGLLVYPQAGTDDKTRAFGTLQTLKTGLADGFKASSPADTLIDMIYTLKKGHRSGAQWMTNGKTLSVLRKWKDSDGNYLWQPALTAGQPSQILGYGIVENEDMPDVGANATPVLFGNYARAYWIFDRIGIRSLRDPFTNKPYVHFYTTKRVGAMLVDSEAVKILKCAA